MVSPVRFSNEIAFHAMLTDLALCGEKGHEVLKIKHTPQGDILVTTKKNFWLWRLITWLFVGPDRSIGTLAVSLFKENEQYAAMDDTFKQAYDRTYAFVCKRGGLGLYGCKDGFHYIEQNIDRLHIHRISEKIQQLAPKERLDPIDVDTRSSSANKQFKQIYQERSSLFDQVFDAASKDMNIRTSDNKDVALSSKWLKTLGMQHIDKGRLNALQGAVPESAIKNFIEYLKDDAFLFRCTKDDILELLSLAQKIDLRFLEEKCSEILDNYSHSVTLFTNDGKSVQTNLRRFNTFIHKEDPDRYRLNATQETVQCFVNYIENKGEPLISLKTKELEELVQLADQLECVFLQRTLSDILYERMSDKMAYSILNNQEKVDVGSTLVQAAMKYVVERTSYDAYRNSQKLLKKLDQIPEVYLKELIQKMSAYYFSQGSGGSKVGWPLVRFREWFNRNCPGLGISEVMYYRRNDCFIRDLQTLSHSYPLIVKTIVTDSSFQRNYAWSTAVAFSSRLRERAYNYENMKSTPEERNAVEFLLKYGLPADLVFKEGLIAMDQDMVDLARKYGKVTETVSNSDSVSDIYYISQNGLRSMVNFCLQNKVTLNHALVFKQAILLASQTKDLSVLEPLLERGDVSVVVRVIQDALYGILNNDDRDLLHLLIKYNVIQDATTFELPFQLKIYLQQVIDEYKKSGGVVLKPLPPYPDISHLRSPQNDLNGPPPSYESSIRRPSAPPSPGNANN
ncbi:MAG: hypothetical protein P4L16_06705 [Chlamydiales bacterium]|nr:hypothetical protein [Chlamydiales bacterium]